ncbi:unnamed protein product [Notodromas monacha]|uniref:Uncharacterized protein n=1 Tax=Notodromas monacha TaxID=399045 RepID=A0A7R9BML8_9CRUS|nr:unnamed protein product [Notodromas monacha]CAG0918297.1 unnamed protein product [Notodromas monacha]
MVSIASCFTDTQLKEEKKGLTKLFPRCFFPYWSDYANLELLCAKIFLLPSSTATSPSEKESEQTAMNCQTDLFDRKENGKNNVHKVQPKLPHPNPVS